jgi:hypothetical protein
MSSAGAAGANARNKRVARTPFVGALGAHKNGGPVRRSNRAGSRADSTRGVGSGAGQPGGRP